MSASNKKNYTMDLTEGSIVKKLILYSLPLMASSMLQLMFNAVDVMVVGHFAGDNSLAAVGSNGPITGLMTNLFVGLSVGTNVLVARYFAGKNIDKLRKTIHTSIVISIIGGIVLALFGVFMARQMLIWTQSPPEVIDLATLYLRIYFLGMPANMIYNFGGAVLRGVGDTKRPLYYLTFAGIINLLLNLLFVIVFRMDVAGVAIATIISQIISAILVLRCLMRESDDIRLEKQHMRIDGPIMVEIMKIGVPAGLQSSMFSLSNTVVQSSINSFGNVVMSGNAAAQNIESFIAMSIKALSQAAVAFVSQNIGAKRYDRIGKIAFTILGVACVFDIILGNAVYLCGKPLLGLYTTSAVVVAAGMVRVGINCVPHFIYALMDVMAGLIRGLGYSVLPMIVALLGVCGFRMAWINMLSSNEALYTIENVYGAYPISWTVTLIAHTICFMIVWCRIKKKHML